MHSHSGSRYRPPPGAVLSDRRAAERHDAGVRRIYYTTTTSDVGNIAFVIDAVVLEDRSDMLYEVSHRSPRVWPAKRSNSLRDGAGSGIHGSQRCGLGFVDRVQREFDRVVGVVVRQVGF